jgi:SAM-dependent methyltransferase
MAHEQQEAFVRRVKSAHPKYFNGTKVIDFGSLDINGNNRIHFRDYTYTGVDIGEGKNVDVVSRAEDYKADKDFDVVISTEMLEHDEQYVDSLKNMYAVCKEGGIIILTAATTGRPEHGTMRSDGGYSSPFTTNYYKNITEAELREAWDFDELFSEWKIEYNRNPFDIYFYGIKKVADKPTTTPKSKPAAKRGRKPKAK